MPDTTWNEGTDDPAVAMVDLPSQGKEGTVETLIWPALEGTYTPEDQHVSELMQKVRTGTSDKLTTREKARLSAMLSATCLDDPSCMVHHMWQSKRGYTELLDDKAFSPLVDFMGTETFRHNRGTNSGRGPLSGRPPQTV